jgi:hypothetical protein
MTDTKGISNTPITQQFSITDGASPLAKNLKPDIAYHVKNVSNAGSTLQLEIQINGKWERVSLALASPHKNIQLSDGKLAFNHDGSKVTITSNASQSTSALSTSDIFKLLNLFVQPKAQKETFIDKALTLKTNQEVSLVAQLNKNLKNTLSIPSLKANIQLPPNVTNQINLNTNILINLQAKNKEVVAKIFLPKSATPALELKVPNHKIAQWLKATPIDLMIKSTNTTSTEVKQNNNITVVNANMPSKTPHWQDAKLISQGDSTKIQPISHPIGLNLTKSAFTSLLNNNSVTTDTTTIRKDQTKEYIKQNNSKNEPNSLVTQKHASPNITPSKSDSFIAPLDKIVTAFKAILSPSAKRAEALQVKPSLASPITGSTHKEALNVPANKDVKTISNGFSSQIKKPQNTPLTDKLISQPIKPELLSSEISKKESPLINKQANETTTKAESVINNKYKDHSHFTPKQLDTATSVKLELIPDSSLKKESSAINKQTDVSTRKVQIAPLLNNKQINLKSSEEVYTQQSATPKNHLISNSNIKSNNILNVKSDPQVPDLNKLVNQAFSKMINPTNISADKVRTEILSTVQPNLLNKNEQTNTFNNSLQNLTLSLFASQTINQQTAENINITSNQTQKLDQLLQLIFPGLKTKTNNIIKETNSKAGIALTQELGQIQQAVQQSQQQLIQSQTVNTQTDNLSNTLLQFLLPMQLPEAVKQTEINLGHYKKSKDNGEQKDVWFIRLNFDFETLGKLQAHAQLMDKNVDCSFSSINLKLIDKVQPHIKILKQKLIDHGLTVGKMTIQQGQEISNDFHKAHSIINIKV